jgi:hypothetical protein
MHKLASFVAVLGFLFHAAGAFADDAPLVVLATVRSYESDETIVRLTCSLDTGRFDVAVGDKRCSSVAARADAIPLRVSLQHRADGWDDVVFEANVTDGANASELQAAVDLVARELFDKLATIKHTVAPAAEKKSATHGMRGGGIALMSVGGASMGIAAVIGLVALVDAAGHAFGCALGSCGSKDFTGYGVAVGATAGLGLVMLVTGGALLSYAPPKSNVALNLGPTGGSLRVAF